MADPKGYLVVPVGYRADGSLHALELDNSDRLKVLVDSITGTVTVVQPDNSYLSPVGAIASASNGALAAGTSTLVVYTVPASQRIRIHVVSMQYTGTVLNVILRPVLNRGGSLYAMAEFRGLVSGQNYTIYPNVVFEEGDIIGIRVLGATLNDVLAGTAFYSRIK